MSPARMLALSIAALIAICPPAVSARAAGAPPPPTVREIGGHLVDGLFLRFYDDHGGAGRFGMPLCDAYVEPASGLLVQYFALARFELHGDRVLLARLGGRLAARRAADPPFARLPAGAPLPADRAYIAATAHSLGGAFGWYWRERGGLELLGYPISEEFVEAQPDGPPLLTQYFERAVLVYRPDLIAEKRVVELALGARYAVDDAPAHLAPGGPLVILGSASMAYPPAGGAGRNIALAAERLNGAVVDPGAVLSFLGAVGEVSAGGGYVPGPAVVGGQVVQGEVGGGICVVATALYRAAWRAGLPIIERRGHRLLLRAFADAPGLDAAVFTPGQDLRVGNDSGGRLYLGAMAEAGRVTVTIWGRGDGRLVELGPADIHAGPAEVEVLNWRSLRFGPGGPERREEVLSRYERPPAPAPAAPLRRQ